MSIENRAQPSVSPDPLWTGRHIDDMQAAFETRHPNHTIIDALKSPGLLLKASVLTMLMPYEIVGSGILGLINHLRSQRKSNS